MNSKLSIIIVVMTIKINMIQKSYIISFLFILIIIVSLFIDVPYKRIVVLADAGILIILSILQLLEINRAKNLLFKTSEILTHGNERDFSILKEKENNIIDFKISNLIEQLQDSVTQSNKILDEKDKLTAEVNQYKKSLEKIQNNLNSEIIEIKNNIYSSSRVLDTMIENFTTLKETCNTEDFMLNGLLDNYASFQNDFTKIAESIQSSRTISKTEIERSGEVIETISGLHNISESNEEQILSIFKGIEDIREVTDIINEVAEKASILSLNAAIESAHAGDAGKGFAVVAEEVGILATSTSEHADNINSALFSVSDLVNQSKSNENKGINSYPDLINDAQAINKAFIAINELLSPLTAMKKPKSFDIKKIKIKDKEILQKSIASLENVKIDMDLYMKRIGKLTLIKHHLYEDHETHETLKIQETAVKPVIDETPIEI